MKTCTKCKIEKDESEFYKRANGRIRSWCKSCEKSTAVVYHRNNPEQVKATRDRYHHTHRDREIARCAAYQKNHKEKFLASCKRYRQKNKAKINKYECKRYREDMLFAVKRRVKARMGSLLRKAFGVIKSKSTNKILGCTGTELLAHLNLTSIDQLANCHLDHICPLSRALTEDEVYKLNHYSNLRIIPAEENLAKSDNWSIAGAMLHLILLGREWPEPPTTEKA